MHTHHSPRSAALSLAVQDAVLGVTGLTDRNRAYSPSRIKPMSLGVLRPDCHDPATAGCLVEVSFMDRDDEERRLQDPAYRVRIARALADGIAAFVGPAVSSVPQDRVEAGDAIDFVCRTGTPEIWRRVAARLRDSDQRFVGGTGASAAGVVHIDTRGRPADW